MRADQLTAACATHGEGPVWDAAAGRLRWVDMLSGDVLTLDETGAISRTHVGEMATALRPRTRGGLVVAVERGFAVLDSSGATVREDTAFDDPACRMNDGGADRQGRFLCGSMDYAMTEPRAALYRYDPDGTVSTVLTGGTSGRPSPAGPHRPRRRAARWAGPGQRGRCLGRPVRGARGAPVRS
jgi:sugar lactone lactonase YvrE